MQLTFEKRLIKTGAIWGDSYKSIYTVRDTTQVVAELEYLNLKGSFRYHEDSYVIEPKEKVFVTKYLLFIANRENPIAEIKAWEGWTFTRPYVKFQDAKKYKFYKLKHTTNGPFWKSNKEAYYKVCLKNEDNILEYKFTKSPRIIKDDFEDIQQYRSLQGVATFQETDFCLLLVGLFLIEMMLTQEND
jgi:hypothetical protein